MRAVLVPIDGPAVVVEHDGTLPALQATVGGYVQAVDLPRADGITCWLNEDGKHLGLPINYLATSLAEHYGAGLHPLDLLVGPALLLVTNEDGDTDGLDEESAAAVLEVAAMLARPVNA